MGTHVLAVVPHDLAQHAADHARGVEHGPCGEQVRGAGLVCEALRQQGHHRLGGGEIARREQDLTRSLVKRGLVLAADTRTNAGVDHIATVRKLALFGLAALYSKRGA